MIRRFSLTNSNGDTWSLDRPGYCFLYEPEGLGYAEGANYERLGTAWVSEAPEPQQGTIRGEIIFPGRSPYETYRAFGRFLRYDPLVMTYETPAGSFYRDVRAAEITKTEIEEGFILRCDLRLVCLGLWYKDGRTDPLGGDVIFTDAAGNELTDAAGDILTARLAYYSVSNMGDVEAPFTLEIRGPVSAPNFALKILPQQLVDVLRIDFPVDLTASQTLKYSSVDGNLYCKITEDGQDDINVVPLFSVNVDVFKKIPVGNYYAGGTGSDIVLGIREEYKRV